MFHSYLSCCFLTLHLTSTISALKSKQSLVTYRTPDVLHWQSWSLHLIHLVTTSPSCYGNASQAHRWQNLLQSDLQQDNEIQNEKSVLNKDGAWYANEDVGLEKKVSVTDKKKKKEVFNSSSLCRNAYFKQGIFILFHLVPLKRKPLNGDFENKSIHMAR